MGVGDVRYTVLQTVNEVFRKLGLATVSSLSANKLTIQTIDFINDTCNDLSDFGNWQEMFVSSNVTCVSGKIDYSVVTSANIKNIGDVYFSQRRGPLRNITIDEMRILTRVTITGTPSQFAVYGTDSNANPVIRVRPTPAQAEDGGIFSLVYYVRTPLYTTSDAATVIPFPARVVVLGTLARAILNESGGTPTPKYQSMQQEYLSARKEALNRFNGDTGWDIAFTPSMSHRR